jgi:prevent-host-death family protein
MPATITLEEAQANLPEIITRLAPGDEILITQDNNPVAKLIGARGPARKPRQPGTMKDKILHMADDFDAPLEDFKEYME